MKLYIIKSDNGKLKIGVTSRLEERFKSLQAGSPSKLTLLYYRDYKYAGSIETVLHQSLIKFHAWGEWFYENEEVYNIINTYLEIDIRKQMLQTFPNTRNLAIHKLNIFGLFEWVKNLT